jgi:hypothetical protein
MELKSIHRIKLGLILFLSSLALYLGLHWVIPAVSVSPAWQSRLGVLRDVVLTLTVVFGVHLLDHIVLLERFADDAKKAAQDAVNDLEKRVSKMVRHLSEGHAKEMRGLAGDVNDLVAAASACGLSKIYPMRDAAAAEDVLKAVTEATSRVWLLGVAFSEKVRFSRLMGALIPKKESIQLPAENNQHLDVRILLLDPMRSPAVFRTFLEARDLDDVSRIVGSKDIRAPKNPDIDHLFDQTLYLDITQAVALLKNSHYAFLQPLVKFYAHNPNCWLVIADDVAFYEPYTLGRPSHTVGNDPCIGHYFPVFRFDAMKEQAKAKGEPFAILTSHFDNLWRTTNHSTFHFDASWKVEVKESVAKAIFKLRLPWLMQVYKGLARKEGLERRVWSHDICRDNCELVVKWIDEKGTVGEGEMSAQVRDSCSGGMQLLLRMTPDSELPQARQRLRVSTVSEAASPLTHALLAPFTGPDLEVKWSRGPDPEPSKRTSTGVCEVGIGFPEVTRDNAA